MDLSILESAANELASCIDELNKDKEPWNQIDMQTCHDLMVLKRQLESQVMSVEEAKVELEFEPDQKFLGCEAELACESRGEKIFIKYDSPEDLMALVTLLKAERENG